jgi:hypothetical protein
VYGRIFPIYHPNAVVSSNPYKKMCLFLSACSALFFGHLRQRALEVKLKLLSESLRDLSRAKVSDVERVEASAVSSARASPSSSLQYSSSSLSAV